MLPSRNKDIIIIQWENNCDFANLTQHNNVNNVDHFVLYLDVQTFRLYWRKS